MYDVLLIVPIITSLKENRCYWYNINLGSMRIHASLKMIFSEFFLMTFATNEELESSQDYFLKTWDLLPAPIDFKQFHQSIMLNLLLFLYQPNRWEGSASSNSCPASYLNWDSGNILRRLPPKSPAAPDCICCVLSVE